VAPELPARLLASAERFWAPQYVAVLIHSPQGGLSEAATGFTHGILAALHAARCPALPRFPQHELSMYHFPRSFTRRPGLLSVLCLLGASVCLSGRNQVSVHIYPSSTNHDGVALRWQAVHVKHGAQAAPTHSILSPWSLNLCTRVAEWQAQRLWTVA
jgi:hypothetical protein